ncbi:hypothetical protein [Pseudoalteromonas sp. JC3]|uniref:hypothetical protein n=1 Tax=Pseudoalteromonas sp. JC3 TaxID=2810196 RepID=UPI0019D2356F|nr:hypothetical protein [Pseudoalteromonas sp. JC3]MBR8843170.1 hypothetical protein [Pseudoalteromonas sp. JC3]WJE09288.1 hypothetical protein QSH61_02125 [Pseudoalteromonas sp. JC3]
MSSRLRYLIHECLDVSVEECSKLLGYANSSPLRKAMSGDCFVDSEKLVRLSLIKNSEGSSVNLHWLITGSGPTLLSSYKPVEQGNMFMKLKTLPPDKVKAIIQLLDL